MSPHAITARTANAKTVTAKRLLSTATLVVLGGAITIGAWVGGQHGLALSIAVFYAVACVALFIWSGRPGDVGALLRIDGDERQRQLDVGATAIAGLTMIVCCVIGTSVDLARGGSGGAWMVVCAVGGVAYIVALTVIRRRH